MSCRNYVVFFLPFLFLSRPFPFQNAWTFTTENYGFFKLFYLSIKGEFSNLRRAVLRPLQGPISYWKRVLAPRVSLPSIRNQKLIIYMYFFLLS